MRSIFFERSKSSGVAVTQPAPVRTGHPGGGWGGERYDAKEDTE
ncbi:MAG: hypothetical protein ABIN94_06325 [Ferruginibacter sp.]